jgi:signal transduction histidine kinase
MLEKDIIILIIGFNVLILMFIGGAVLFVQQYRKRKMQHKVELDDMAVEHKKELLEMKLASQQQTMVFLGKEIHDGVGQKLTLASIYVQSKIHKAEGQDKQLEEVNKILSDSLQDLRRLSHTLVNPEVVELDLIELIRLDLKRIKELNQVDVDFEIKGLPFKLETNVKNALLRIVEEFSQNSLKYAQFKKLKVSIVFKDKTLMLSCIDDGIGFDMSTHKPGIGLGNIKKRAYDIGAKLEIESHENKGTQLQLNYNLS